MICGRERIYLISCDEEQVREPLLPFSHLQGIQSIGAPILSTKGNLINVDVLI
jgi:hypothetical protein